MSEDQKAISNNWIKIAKPDDGDMVFVTQSKDLPFHEALGMLKDAMIRYETQYKIELEYKELGRLKKMTDEIKLTMGSMVQLARSIESVMVKLSAVSQTMNHKVGERDGKDKVK